VATAGVGRSRHQRNAAAESHLTALVWVPPPALTDGSANVRAFT